MSVIKDVVELDLKKHVFLEVKDYNIKTATETKKRREARLDDILGDVKNLSKSKYLETTFLSRLKKHGITALYPKLLRITEKRHFIYSINNPDRLRVTLDVQNLYYSVTNTKSPSTILSASFIRPYPFMRIEIKVGDTGLKNIGGTLATAITDLGATRPDNEWSGIQVYLDAV